MTSGLEWIIEAYGCAEHRLRDIKAVRGLFASILGEMKLRPVGEALWHEFPGTGGITGICLLAESHLACHTFPEYGSLCINLFCCVPRPAWDFEGALKERFGAQTVSVRRIARPYVRKSEAVPVGEVAHADVPRSVRE
jgi:S-adenosylmethionine decarboxylase